MNMIKKITRCIVIAPLFLIVILPQSLMANSLSSQWVMDRYSKSRLFVGGYDRDRKILHLGWQVSLQDGWKTYWRSPGEAGLPPRWAWNKAENINNIAVKWPLPKLMQLFDMDTYVYYHEVILPIEVTVKDENTPVSLALGLDYMICSDICVPQHANYKLTVASPKNMKISIFQQAQLDSFRDLVPLEIDSKDTKLTLGPENTLLIQLPNSLANVKNIIVEGPKTMLFGQASLKDNGLFAVSYNGPETLKGKTLTLTIVPKEGRASEIKATVQAR